MQTLAKTNTVASRTGDAYNVPNVRFSDQVRPRHHAQGQGAEWRPRPVADAHVDHVPEVPR